MRSNLRKIIIISVLILVNVVARSSTDEIKTTIHSRAFIDGTLSGYNSNSIEGRFKLEEFRFGFKSKFNKYTIKADLSLNGSKIVIKDLFINYDMQNSKLTVGNGYEPYSLDVVSSTVDMRFHQPSSSTLASANGRRLGVTYQYHKPHFYLGAGVYSNNDLKSISTDYADSYALTSRLVYRNIRSEYRLFHVGVAGSFRTADRSEGATKSISTVGITSLFGENVAAITLKDAGTEQKGMLEILSTWERCLVQSEYYVNNYKTMSSNFTTHGGYLQFAYLLIGNGFKYNQSDASIGKPKGDRTLELVARVNYITLNDSGTDLYGGSHSDVSVGANFYINKYVGMKLNFGYLIPGENTLPFYKEDLFIGQLRLQYAF